MAWCVYHGNGAHGRLGIDGELVGRHIENGLPPCELEGLQIKAFYSCLMCVRAHVCVRQWVGGLLGDTRCLDKPSELLALPGEKAIGITYSPR